MALLAFKNRQLIVNLRVFGGRIDGLLKVFLGPIRLVLLLIQEGFQHQSRRVLRHQNQCLIDFFQCKDEHARLKIGPSQGRSSLCAR